MVKQKADFTIFLNNDTVVDPYFVEPLINEMESNSTVKQATPKIFYADDLEYIWFGGGKINLWAGWIRHLGIRQKIQLSFHLIGMSIMLLAAVFVCVQKILNP